MMLETPLKCKMPLNLRETTKENKKSFPCENSKYTKTWHEAPISGSRAKFVLFSFPSETTGYDSGTDSGDYHP